MKRALALFLGSAALHGCMGDGDCSVYDYAPSSIRLTFSDVVTGEPLCDKPNSAKPGKLFPIDGECAYSLAGWYGEGDGGVATTVEITIQGYEPVTETFRPGEGTCGEVTPPPPKHFELTPGSGEED